MLCARHLVAVLFIAVVALGSSPGKMELCQHRSVVLANPLAAHEAVHQGEADNLNFLLTDFHMAVLQPDELALLRATILARHGQAFTDPSLREHFLSFQWYSPASSSAMDMLLETDIMNLQLIDLFENSMDSPEENLPEASRMAGLWHASPVVGSGYSQTYRFKGQGFLFWGNSMDGANRLLGISGTWAIENGSLKLEADTLIILEGGEIVEAYASYASDCVIENGQPIALEPDPPLVFRIPLSGYMENYARDSGDEGFDYITGPSIIIGSSRFWRIGDGSERL